MFVGEVVDSGEFEVVKEAGRVSARVGTTRGEGEGLDCREGVEEDDRDGAEDGGAGGGGLVDEVVVIVG